MTNVSRNAFVLHSSVSTVCGLHVDHFHEDRSGGGFVAPGNRSPTCSAQTDIHHEHVLRAPAYCCPISSKH